MRALKPGGESRWIWFITIIAVGLGIFAFITRPGPTPDSATDPTDRPAATAMPSPSPRPSERPTQDTSPSVEPVEATQPDAASLGLPDGVALPAGLGGSGSGRSLPRTTLKIRVFSTEPLYRVSYIIPTSDDQRYGQDDGVGSSWSHTTRVWGKPDYAAVFVQAFWPGVKVTCVITVGGRETERRTIIGPQGAMWCQG
ncbi:hypothetical protein [Nocardioides sp. LML1-1-1.1]|uniref:hypothetical protein n=1 Tax=Nocardioides sp. LML1-1-1.1 TaxID=3135248 RepID=UPI00342621FA